MTLQRRAPWAAANQPTRATDMKNSALRTLALLACMGIGIATVAPAAAQTPITVQVINDSGLSDSDVYLLLAGQDVSVIPAAGAATNFPFAVAGVAATPAGTVSNTTSQLVTGAGTTPAASAPLSITGAASTIAMSFSSATIPIGGTSKLTINLPNGAAAQALTQLFTVAMPAGVTTTSTQGTAAGMCTGVAVTPTQISIAAGQSLPANGCTVQVTVTSSTPGTVTATTSFLQTAPANVIPASAPLTVVSEASAMTMAFQPPSIGAVRGATSQLTINIPNASGAAQTLNADFTDPMPTSVVVDTTAGNTGTCIGVKLAKTRITLQQGATIPIGGCTIVATVKPIAAGGALANLVQTGLQVTSPYSGNALPVYQFSMTTVSSGNLFLSYTTPVEYPPAPTVRDTYRFQPLEFSYSEQIVSNGDLTSIDFYGIPLELQTFAPSDTGLQYPLDRVSYYTSTPTLRRAFINLNPDLRYAFVGSSSAGNTVFNPGANNDYSSFLRIIGPNQVAATGASPLPKGTPTGNPKPWPYPSFAGYLDALANSGYTFNEVDDKVISAYAFNYTGTITTMTAATVASCLNPTLAAPGWLIKLTGTTQAPSPLPSNADICIPLPATDPGTGSADFIIYGAVQNCESLGLASGSLYACSDTDTAALAAMSNSVYGWIQADVLSALNFGYMQGQADATTNNVGYSNVWYNLPPVQYPFGLARPAPDDGNYNPWAAMMYNHSDAYGFAFSDRKGRPSPDIAYPIGGTLRIWILPDKRLDAPMVSAGAAAGGSSDNSIPLSWPPVEGADHYVVTWSPPYTPTSKKVYSNSYSIPNLAPGTPYAITVTAYNADESMRSYEMPVRAMTAGVTTPPTTSNASLQFGVNWNLPAYPQLPAPQPVTLTPQSASLTVSSAAWFVDMTFFPATIMPTSSALMTITLGNTNLTNGTLAAEFTASMPAGVVISGKAGNGNTCPKVTYTSTEVKIPANTLIQAGGCTIAVNVTSRAVGANTVTTSVLALSTATYAAASATLRVTTSTWYMAQTIAPGTIAPGTRLPVVPSTMTVLLVNTNSTALLLTAPLTISLPAGMTFTSAYLGTCPGGPAGSPISSAFSLPAGTAIPAGGCSVAGVVTATGGTLINTPGSLQANTIPAPDIRIAGTPYYYSGNGGYNAPPGVTTPITLGTTQSFPLEVWLNGAPVWVANYYLTFEGSTNVYSIGPCGSADVCVGPNLVANSVPFDTVGAPNFLERQGATLSPAGGGQQPGWAGLGPPFGGANGIPYIGVSFTPIANKRAAVVKYPSLGAPAPPRFDAPCGKAKMAGTNCH